MFKQLKKELKSHTQENTPFPRLEKNVLDWIDTARPLVGGKSRDFGLEPFWIPVYEDNHSNIMIVNGRQTFKTTFCTDVLACYSTSHSNIESSYVVDNETHLSAFSLQRLRKETFLANPLLKQFLPHGRANIGQIALLNDSIIYLLTDENEYQKVESRSNKILMLDEAQYQEIQFLQKALYTLSQTRGRVFILGIGGEAGSEYHKLWNRTDQREWIYDDKYWREKLTFDSYGQVNNDSDKLKSILSGRWVAQKPENHQYRGYHMSQTIFARIPATIEDAIHKYNLHPELSVEYQHKNYPASLYLSHTLGDFYKAERRPITPEMVYACMNPYRYLTLQKAEQVTMLKNIFGNEIRVLLGVDFGSSPAASATVISIIIKWKKSLRYQLAWIEKRPQEHQLDQAGYIASLGRAYNVDFGVGDLGYGQIQVKVIQDGGTNSQNKTFEGMKRRHFVGCRTIGDETKPQMEYRTAVDEHGEQLGRIQIDKTSVIQNFIDLIGWNVSHPKRPNEKNWQRPKLMIPSKFDYETSWLVDDFCSITRKDLEISIDAGKEDPRQKATKTFNHPPDSVMSIIYCMVADANYDEGAYRIYPLGRRSV